MITTSYANDKKPLEQISYNVVRNNEIIGTIKVSCNTKSDSTIYALESSIDVKYILKFSIRGKETAIYKNGILIYSSVYRKVNNKIKANHSVTYKNDSYHLEIGDTEKQLGFEDIQDNLVMLYFKEPKNLNRIYCDNLKRMVNLEPLGEGKYKVAFSEDKFNIFHYENGRCVKVEANSSLFSVTLIPA
ncbi:DUF6134 family protein [Litoribaculum gwangyangense]|uniref:Uncharacterized protein n=1 Tax=Litoribaculum gwangyangense TaxID=1130722 RepID=A0ABP9CL46_9FLAO